jgi:DNA invertase Pin-like site-specific DNA recombinase
MIYGYLRVSTDKQDENNQKLGVDEKALRMCVQIDEYIVDAGVSGTKEPEKRKLGPLMEKLKPGDTIIASELSRLGRSLYMVMRILEFCMKHEVKVITVKEGYELGDNIQSKVLAFAFSLSAEIERDMISRRTKEALQRKKNEGVIIGRAIGSRNVTVKLDKHHDEIVKYLESGLGYSAIGRLLGVHRNTVTRFCLDKNILGAYNKRCEKHKLNPKCRPAVKGVCEDAYLIKQIEAGLSYKDIAKLLGISSSKVSTYVRKEPLIYAKFTEVQTKIRIERNGSMNRSKQRGQSGGY